MASAKQHALLLLALLVSLLSLGCRQAQVLPQPGFSPIDSARLRQAIDRSAGYLTRACAEDGRFAYRVSLDPDQRLEREYNTLRHAGAIYALACYDRTHPNEAARAAALRASRYLKEKTLAPMSGRDDTLGVWSLPEIVHTKDPPQVKLGGIGLGLVALLSVERVQPGATPLETLRRLGKGAVFLQKPDGDFHAKFVPTEGGRENRWISLYYPGEAALGLTMLYEKDDSPAWILSAARALGYLARSRAGETNVPGDHWALLATARLLPLYERGPQPVPRRALVNHAAQICESMLAMRKHCLADSLGYGGFTGDARTCPTATTLEGLLAALEFLPEDEVLLRRRIEAAVHDGMEFVLRSQTQAGEYAGAIPRATRPLPSNHPRYSLEQNELVHEVRIDYVQHALCAMLQYERMFFGAENGSREP